MSLFRGNLCWRNSDARFGVDKEKNRLQTASQRQAGKSGFLFLKSRAQSLTLPPSLHRTAPPKRARKPAPNNFRQANLDANQPPPQLTEEEWKMQEALRQLGEAAGQ